MATGFQPDLQHTAPAGGMIIEFGAGDYTQLSQEDGTESGTASHGVVTGLTYIAGGFMLSHDASDEIRIGCISSQMMTADHTWGGRFIDFTLDYASDGTDYYMIFGW